MTKDLLLAALRSAHRRYRMPPLPPDAEAARAAGPEAALAFAMESARHALAAGSAPEASLRGLFVEALAALAARASAPDGDAAFQAQVLRASDPAADEYAALQEEAPGDVRAVRSGVDAIAHPGKLRTQAPGAARDALARLHAVAVAQDWAGLRRVAGILRAQDCDAAVEATLARLLAGPALARLERGAVLAAQPAVQDWLALVARAGPQAGTDAALARGRDAARAGAAVEEATFAAFARIAGDLDARAPGARHRALQGLVPRAIVGAPEQAKDEWDVALVREAPGGACELLLLAEAKAAPAAATRDRPRLLRGLARLARAGAAADVVFATREGEWRVGGASLRALAPDGDDAPETVIYSCIASEAQAPLLAHSARTLLLQQRATLAWATGSAAAASPSPDLLGAVWEDLLRTPRLAEVLRQYATARAAREAMLHPDDLVAAFQGLPRNR